MIGSATLVNGLRRLPLIVLASVVSTAAHGHSFGKLYSLPVPLWMYLYGAAAALLGRGKAALNRCPQNIGNSTFGIRPSRMRSA